MVLRKVHFITSILFKFIVDSGNDSDSSISGWEANDKADAGVSGTK
jgi:hypothetical protein